MDNQVRTALNASLESFARVSGQDAALLGQSLTAVFDSDLGFLDKVEDFDRVFDEHLPFEELREVFFDLLMINFFASDAQRLEEDYLDSKEWTEIEEDTIDRGTELLNLLLYLNECHDEHVNPSLGDFLKEFLLVEEDDFQDEFHIYESLISNQHLAEGSVEEICKTADATELGEELEPVFVPLLTFFHQPEPDAKILDELQRASSNREYDVAVYSLIANFNTAR